MRSMKINEIAVSWDRVTLSLGAAFRPQRPQLISKPPTREIHGNACNPMEIDEIAASWERVKVAAISPQTPQLVSKLPTHEIHGDP